MNAFALATDRFRRLIILALVALAAIAVACGGGDDTTSPTATSESTGATSPTSAPGSSATLPTATSRPGSELGGSMDCSPLSGIPGIVALGLETDGFTTVAPDSEFGQEVVALFISVIESAMGVDVFANCFSEVNISGEATQLWVSFELSSSAVAGSMDAISSELVSRGVPVDNSPSMFGTLAEGGIGYLVFDSLPSIDSEVGGILYLASPYVFVAVGTEFTDPSALFPTTVPTASVDPAAPTSIPSAVSTTGVVADVEAVLLPWLEQVTLTHLTLTSNNTGSIGSNTTATLVYAGDSRPVPDAAALQRGIVNYGGMLDSGLSFGGTISEVFNNATIAGYSVSGTITITDVVTVLLLIDN